MDNRITLNLWNHGTAGDVSTPCGEVDVLKVSGSDISSDLLQLLLVQAGEHKNDWFGHLPTEEPLNVVADCFFDGEFWLDVVSFEIIIYDLELNE
jgi:hypothetical protein